MSAIIKMSVALLVKSALVITALSLLAAEARANDGFEQTYIGQSMNLQMAGRDQALLLRQHIRLQQGAPVDSLTLIAASARGRGGLRVEADGRTIFNTQVDEQFAPIHVAVRALAHQNSRDLRIITDGNIQIVHMGVAIPAVRTVPGRPGPDPMPGPGAGPVRRPPHPGGGAYPAPLPDQGGGVVGGPMRGILSDAEFAAILRDVSREAFDSGRNSVLNLHMDRIARTNQLVLMEQAARLISLYSFDDGKIQALTKIRPVLLIRIESIDLILQVFTFDSGRNHARNILLR